MEQGSDDDASIASIISWTKTVGYIPSRYASDIRGVMTPVFVTYSLWTKSVGYIPKRSGTNIRGVMGRLLGRGIVEGGLFR